MRALLTSIAAAAALAASSVLAAETPPAPTLLWSDDVSATFIRGLTRSGTTVTVRINDRVAAGLRYGPARGGVASFAVPWPAALPAGVYEVTATAAAGGSQSLGSQAVDVVVAGVRRAPLRPA